MHAAESLIGSSFPRYIIYNNYIIIAANEHCMNEQSPSLINCILIACICIGGQEKWVHAC